MGGGHWLPFPTAPSATRSGGRHKNLPSLRGWRSGFCSSFRLRGGARTLFGIHPLAIPFRLNQFLKNLGNRPPALGRHLLRKLADFGMNGEVEALSHFVRASGSSFSALITREPSDVSMALARAWQTNKVGLRIPFSIWLTAPRLTPAFFASFSWERPRSNRIAFNKLTTFRENSCDFSRFKGGSFTCAILPSIRYHSTHFPRGPNRIRGGKTWREKDRAYPLRRSVRNRSFSTPGSFRKSAMAWRIIPRFSRE